MFYQHLFIYFYCVFFIQYNTFNSHSYYKSHCYILLTYSRIRSIYVKVKKTDTRIGKLKLITFLPFTYILRILDYVSNMQHCDLQQECELNVLYKKNAIKIVACVVTCVLRILDYVSNMQHCDLQQECELNVLYCIKKRNKNSGVCCYMCS